jgi:pimeloyl-ACP methyl ester carboxylesterase
MQKKKQRWGTILWKGSILSITIFVAACLVFDRFVQFRMSDAELNTFFTSNHVAGKICYYQSGGRTIRYVAVGKDSLPTLLLIHGAPSSLSVYQDYFKDTSLLHHFKILAVDRPGYGYSGFGNPEPSIQKQAAFIRPILDSLQLARHPKIVMGGSYGSSIACRLAMDYPNLVDGLVLVAPSLKPGAEKIYWFTPLIEQPALNWFIPRMFQSANNEKIHHHEGLEAMLPYWKNIRIPVVYIQGEKDQLIDTANAGFARKQLINAPYLEIRFLKGEPHFVAYSKRPLVRLKMLELLQRILASGR